MKFKLAQDAEIKTLDKKDGSGTFEMAYITDGHDKYSMYINAKYGQKDKETIRQWLAGMEIEVIIYENNGYKNFRIPTKTDLLDERVSKLETQTKWLYTHMNKIPKVKPEVNQEQVDDEILISDLPI